MRWQQTLWSGFFATTGKEVVRPGGVTSALGTMGVHKPFAGGQIWRPTTKITSKGTMTHCSSGVSPTPNGGTIGISVE